MVRSLNYGKKYETTLEKSCLDVFAHPACGPLFFNDGKTYGDRFDDDETKNEVDNRLKERATYRSRRSDYYKNALTETAIMSKK